MDVGTQIAAYVLTMVPPPLRETPQCIALLGNMSAMLDEMIDATKAFDAGPESAARLRDAAAGYCDALAQLSAWGAQVRAAADEAKGAALSGDLH